MMSLSFPQLCSFPVTIKDIGSDSSDICNNEPGEERLDDGHTHIYRGDEGEPGEDLGRGLVHTLYPRDKDDGYHHEVPCKQPGKRSDPCPGEQVLRDLLHPLEHKPGHEDF